MGLNLSPDYSYRTLKSDGTMFSGSVVSSRNNQEVAKFGYTVGLNIYFNITSRAAFETGIQYSNKGYKTKLMDLVWLQPDPSLPTKGKFIYNISYLDIPAKINLTFGEKKLRFCAGAGLAVNFLIKQTITSIQNYTNGDTKRKTSSSNNNYKKLNLSPIISAGFDYTFNNKNSLKVEPTFRYGILKIIDAPVSENLWNVGLNIGYYFKLK